MVLVCGVDVFQPVVASCCSTEDLGYLGGKGVFYKKEGFLRLFLI